MSMPIDITVFLNPCLGCTCVVELRTFENVVNACSFVDTKTSFLCLPPDERSGLVGYNGRISYYLSLSLSWHLSWQTSTINKSANLINLPYTREHTSNVDVDACPNTFILAKYIEFTFPCYQWLIPRFSFNLLFRWCYHP